MLQPDLLKAPSESLTDAVARLDEIIKTQAAGDISYWNSQKARFLYSTKRIIQISPPPCRILDIGSHYLHQSSILRLLGYEVWALDVETFVNISFVAERARILGIPNQSVTDIHEGKFLPEYDDFFDLVVCTATLEHVTFNPVSFWRRIYEILSIGGAIYITTPNSYRLKSLIRSVWRLVTFNGIGISVDDVLKTVTYGHHWKEYSARELRTYFQTLSTDFSLTVRSYSDGEQSVSFLKRLVSTLAGAIPVFRSDLEAVARLNRKTGFALSQPQLPTRMTDVNATSLPASGQAVVQPGHGRSQKVAD